MSDYLKAARIAENQSWTKRIIMVAVNVAIDVLAEDPETADHAVRAALAANVIRGEQISTAALPRIVLTNETVRAAAVAGLDLTGEAVSDGDIEYTVVSIWTNTAKALFPTP